MIDAKLAERLLRKIEKDEKIQKWIASFDFDLWCSFVYRGHQNSLEKQKMRALARIRMGRAFDKLDKSSINTQEPRAMEPAVRVMRNFLKRCSIRNRTHILALGAGDFQPGNGDPHFHLAIKVENRDKLQAVKNDFIVDWLHYNPSSVDNPSVHIADFENWRRTWEYIEGHRTPFQFVACSKRRNACRKNKCKEVGYFVK